MYNKAQWIDSFGGQLSLLRPHLTPRLLELMSVAAWHRQGTKGEDPIETAKALSTAFDKSKSGAWFP